MGHATLGLRGLASMAHLLARTYGLDQLLETASEHACSALGAATVSISRIEADADRIRTIINVGDLAPHEERWPAHETYSISGDMRLMSAIRERTSWVDSLDDPSCGDRERALLSRLGKGSSLVTAIVVDGESWGEFYATRHVGAAVFNDDAVAYAEVLVAILAAAVSRTIREAELADLAFHDPLTGLLNRRGLDARAAEVFDLADEAERRVGVVAVDIDGLKRVNDTEGHAKGDQVIRAVASTLTFTFDTLESSYVARVGGDEFTVLVAGADVDGVQKMIDHICQEVSLKSSRIGLSAGLATAMITAVSTFTASDLFAAADRALYVAKRSQSPVAVLADDLGA